MALQCPIEEGYTVPILHLQQQTHLMNGGGFDFFLVYYFTLFRSSSASYLAFGMINYTIVTVELLCLLDTLHIALNLR